MNTETINLKSAKKDMIGYIVIETELDTPSAIELFYNSMTFEKLSDETTGLYIESPRYVYEILKQELATGKLE